MVKKLTPIQCHVGSSVKKVRQHHEGSTGRQLRQLLVLRLQTAEAGVSPTEEQGSVCTVLFKVRPCNKGIMWNKTFKVTDWTSRERKKLEDSCLFSSFGV